MKKIIMLLSALSFIISASAKTEEVFLQKDLSHIIQVVTDNLSKDLSRDAQDAIMWKKYLNSPHPSVATVKSYFEEAALEFKVPAELLEAIGYVENNWTQIGPTIDRGWGIMHLVSNGTCTTLEEASALLKLDPQILKDNAKENIRGAAALLARYAGEERRFFNKYEDWYIALQAVSGLYGEEFRKDQAYRYLNTLKSGVYSHTNWDESFSIEAKPQIEIVDLESKDEIRSEDYAPAICTSATLSHNYSSRSGQDIDTWVNHWIGEGTYSGCISWFVNPANTGDIANSAHFVVRSSDGQILNL